MRFTHAMKQSPWLSSVAPARNAATSRVLPPSVQQRARQRAENTARWGHGRLAGHSSSGNRQAGSSIGGVFIDSPFSMLWVPHLPALREACGWAAQFELSVRITMEALFGAGGTSKDLDRAFDRVVNELRPFLATEQVEALTAINLCQLRHDLLHGRLSQAYGKLGGKTNDPAVAAVIELPAGEPILPVLERALRGAARPIPETKTADAGIVGWVAQAGQRGIPR